MRLGLVLARSGYTITHARKSRPGGRGSPARESARRRARMGLSDFVSVEQAMTNVFVIQNQHGHYLGKQQQWLDGRDRKLLYRTEHLDEAINTVFELSSKDIWLRANALACPLDEHRQPDVEPGPAIPDDTEMDSPESAVAEGEN